MKESTKMNSTEKDGTKMDTTLEVRIDVRC